MQRTSRSCLVVSGISATSFIAVFGVTSGLFPCSAAAQGHSPNTPAPGPAQQTPGSVSSGSSGLGEGFLQLIYEHFPEQIPEIVGSPDIP